MLASSIDLKVEFKLVAFVQFTKTRPFNRADVHERVRLAIVTRDEAEALHRVEELDRTRSAFTRQLALGSGRLCSNCDHVTHDLKISCRNLPAAIHEIEFELLPFGQTLKAGTLDRADVNEHVFATVFTLDEAEALLSIEELDDALAGSDNLGRHSAATASAAAWAAEAATAAAATAAEAAAITAAKATAITTAEAATITAAKTAAAATTTEATAIATAETAAGKSAATATAVGIETTFVAESVALILAATAPPSVKTHRNQ